MNAAVAGQRRRCGRSLRSRQRSSCSARRREAYAADERGTSISAIATAKGIEVTDADFGITAEVPQRLFGSCRLGRSGGIGLATPSD